GLLVDRFGKKTSTSQCCSASRSGSLLRLVLARMPGGEHRKFLLRRQTGLGFRASILWKGLPPLQSVPRCGRKGAKGEPLRERSRDAEAIPAGVVAAAGQPRRHLDPRTHSLFGEKVSRHPSEPDVGAPAYRRPATIELIRN